MIIEPHAGRADLAGAQSKEDQDTLLAILADPDMQAAVTRGSQAAVEELAGAIATRLGVGVDTELYPRLAASAVVTTQLLTIDLWLRTDPPGA